MHRSPRAWFVLRFPLITVIVLGGCLLGFVGELSLLARGRDLSLFLLKFGIVPLRLVSYFERVEGSTFVNSVLPFFSSLFLHGGFLHLLTNLLYLWLVGDVLEDWLGRTRFAVLFVFGAAAELIIRIGVSGEPSGHASVGISGSVAALIGGYVVVLGRLLQKEDGTLSFSTLLGRLPLILGVAAWFPVQLLNAYLSIAPTCQTLEPVSWLGLFSSFLLGMFLVSLSGGPGAPTTAEATAFPREDEVSILEA